MSKCITRKQIEQQTSLIVAKMNSLILGQAYDGRANIKIRFSKLKNTTNIYFIELLYEQKVVSDTISLEFDPFNAYWLILKHKIKKQLSIPYCRKSRFGGYTFYN